MPFSFPLCYLFIINSTMFVKRNSDDFFQLFQKFRQDQRKDG